MCVWVSKEPTINRIFISYPVLLKRGWKEIKAKVQSDHSANLFFAVFQHVLVLGQLFVLFGFDALGLVPETVGVLLLQPLDGLLLLPLQVLDLLVILALLTLEETEGNQVKTVVMEEEDTILSFRCANVIKTQIPIEDLQWTFLKV